MWVAVLPAVLLTVFQAVIFTKKSISMGKKLGITSQQLKRATAASAVASLGPAVVSAIGCVALIVAMGGPVAWMRLSFVGNASYELVSARWRLPVRGATLGGEGMNMNIFCSCLWVMSIGCLGWILVGALFTDKMDKLNSFVAKGNAVKLGIITTGSIIGVYSYLATNQCISASSSSGAVLALFSAGGVHGIFHALQQKSILISGCRSGE
ncbi:MAG: DUF5058 family protein [Enterocloster sp.]